MKLNKKILTIAIVAIAIIVFGITQTALAQSWTKTYSTMSSDSIYVHAGGSQGSGYATRVEATSDQVSDSVVYSRKVPLTIFDGTIRLDKRAWMPGVEHWLSLTLHHGDTTIKTLGQIILSEDTLFGEVFFNDWDNTLNAFDSISLIIFATDYLGTQIADFDNFRNGAGTILYDGDEMGEINGTVFNDANQNGVIDSGENGISNWKIYLDIGGIHQDSTTTSISGTYTFLVSRGIYTIKAESKNGWTPTTSDSTITVGDTLHWQINFGEYAPLAYYMTVNSRWNIVSLPCRAYEPSVKALFPTAISKAFAYNGSNYQSYDTIKTGIGYWIKFPEKTSVIIVGDSIHKDTVTVQEGWNMVGGLTETISVNDIMVDPPTMVTSQFFTYDGSYITADSIKPGVGYWVKASEAGTLYSSIPTGSLAKTSYSRINIVNTGELPPPAPDMANGEWPMANSQLPTEFHLEQNYPNPFNPITSIKFIVNSSQFVTLKVYNLLGQEVATLVNEAKEPGNYSVQWNAGNNPSGMYFYHLQTSGYTETKKMVLMK